MVGDTNVNIICLVRLFMNVCASYIHAINSPDQQGSSYSYTEPFGPYQNPMGTTEFPWFDFETPLILKQFDGWNCGLACVVNAVAFVHHFEKIDFVLSHMQLVTDAIDEVRYNVDSTKYNLCLFGEQLEKKTARKYEGFTTKDFLRRLRQEFVQLIDDLAELRSGAHKEIKARQIQETAMDNFVDLTIQFPKNITPQKSKKNNETNVILDKRKQKILKKKEVMDALQPHFVNDQKSQDEANAFAKVFFSKCWGLYDLYET